MSVLRDLLGIRVPVLLAPMAAGPGTPALAGAVAAVGGLGVLGVSGITSGLAASWVADARAAGKGGPIGVNAQVAPATRPTCDEAALLEVLRPFRRELGLPEVPLPPPPADPPGVLVEAALEAGASVLTTFGDPEPVLGLVERFRVPLLCMITTPAEAIRAVEAGVQAVIAQGAEAGGHRGTFTIGSGPPPLTETLQLVGAVIDVVGSEVPVVASGGIVDRAGVRAAFAAGASAVSCGTVFLQAEEAGVGEAYRGALRAAGPESTIVTDVVTGRPARWLRNRLVDALVDAGVGNAGWPRQGALIADIRRAAGEQGRADLLPMLAGTNAAATGARRPAAAIVDELALGVPGSRSA